MALHVLAQLLFVEDREVELLYLGDGASHEVVGGFVQVFGRDGRLQVVLGSVRTGVLRYLGQGRLVFVVVPGGLHAGFLPDSRLHRHRLLVPDTVVLVSVSDGLLGGLPQGRHRLVLGGLPVD